MTGTNRWRKALACVTLAALAWTGVAVPVPGGTASAATPFSDVKPGHWAEKHIHKLALQGLLLGNVDGTYKPADPVTREQAVLIALRFLGLEDDVPEATMFPEFFEVSDYYKKYVNYAFRQNLLRSEEEFGLAQSEAGRHWGKAPATREWLARLIVRTIGKEAEATAKAGAGTGFADDARIGEEYRGYVRAAVDLGLIKGVTETEFRPQDIVNRATIATLFSRAQSVYPVAYSGQTSGILFERTPDRLTVLHEDGTMTDYTVSADTFFYRADAEAAASPDDMVTYGAVTVISRDGRVADYVELLDATPKVAAYEGTFLWLDENTQELFIRVGNERRQFAYDANHPPRVTDLEDQLLSLGDLETNMPVKVLVDTLRTPGRVVSVSVKLSAVNKTGKGTIVSVDAAARTVTVTDAEGNRETRSVAEEALITLDKRLMDLEMLQPGDVVTYTVKAGVITAITVNQRLARTVSGTLYDVDTGKKTILYRENGENKFIPYVSGVTVSIDGLENAGVLDLLEGDELLMTLDNENRVKAIKVTNRSVRLMSGATVVEFLASRNLLIVDDAEGGTHTFYLSPNVRYELDGEKLKADDGKNRLTRSQKLDIRYSGNTVYAVSFVTRYVGSLLEVDKTGQTLKLALENGTTVTIPYHSYAGVEVYGSDTYKDVGDLRYGDRITVVLDSSQSEAVLIKLEQKVQFEVVSVDSSGNKIRGKRGNQPVVEWTVGTQLPLLDSNGTPASVWAVPVGAHVNVTYMGQTPVQIKLVPVLVGRVVSVNVAAGTIELALWNGSVQTVSVGMSPVVQRDGGTASSLSSVREGDRIEIRQDEYERYILTVMSTLQKNVSYADAARRVLYWPASSPNDKSNFIPLHPQAYVHKDSTVLSLSELKNGDAVTIYVLRGQAMEIEKRN